MNSGWLWLLLLIIVLGRVSKQRFGIIINTIFLVCENTIRFKYYRQAAGNAFKVNNAR